jgi:hypothetical protein
MSWENCGAWHADHIVPLSWFPFDKDPSLMFVASHWTNLRPLWSTENLVKGNRYMTPEEAVAVETISGTPSWLAEIDRLLTDA